MPVVTVEVREQREREDLEAREKAETTARRRASKGAKLFDDLFPEWPFQVRLTTLRMSEPGSPKAGGSCVLAQISGQRGVVHRNYQAGKTLLATRLERPEFTRRMETFYGLNVSPNPNDDVQFRELTAAWKDEIRERRALARSTRDIIR